MDPYNSSADHPNNQSNNAKNKSATLQRRLQAFYNYGKSLLKYLRALCINLGQLIKSSLMYNIVLGICVLFLFVSVLGYFHFMKIAALISKIKEFFGDALDKAKDFAALVKDKMETMFDMTSGKIKDKVSECANGIAVSVIDGPKKAINELQEALKNLTASIGKGGDFVKNLNPFKKRNSYQPLGESVYVSRLKYKQGISNGAPSNYSRLEAYIYVMIGFAALVYDCYSDT